MMDSRFGVPDEGLSEAMRRKKKQLEEDPSSRWDAREYLPKMQHISSDILDKVMGELQTYQAETYGPEDVVRALEQETCGIEEVKALLSPAAKAFVPQMAEKAAKLTAQYFGKNVSLFTPLYISNYCDNYCVYCGFNCYNQIRRLKLSPEEIEREMKVIADTGMEEVLILTGESRAYSGVPYIGEALKLAKKYFKNIGLEVYPVNVDEYEYLHECGADYVTVFQETYDFDRYQDLHLLGAKRIWQYRFETQERALMAGMRGVGLSALLGLADYHKDALATALHAYFLQRKYKAAEISLSCPRLRPILHNETIGPHDVDETALTQILCAYRIFLPYAGITVSTRERPAFRDGILRIAATKVSAGVSTGIGDHADKYEGKKATEEGDEQFEISDQRSLAQMVQAIKGLGLQPVLNAYVDVG